MASAWSLDSQFPNPKNMTKGDLEARIAFMVEAILKGVNERHPHSMDELLLKHEIGNNNTFTIARKDNSSKRDKATKPEITAFEFLRASLGFIFQERYGWKEEAVDGMTLPDVFIALEHAMECDAPSKKSVWSF
jgi:hypothetical protein